MKKITLSFLFSFFSFFAIAQTNPVITSWLINTTEIKGRHYLMGNSTVINDTASANVQSVFYSTIWAYIKTNGVPSYITGPFQSNPTITTAQNAIFKFPLNPTKNNGVLSPTTGGNIGIFINGVALFDYRDGVSWKTDSNKLAGGPIGGQGDQKWNRDAVVAEKGGFDCSKGHPANGNYHHHQNPSAFKLDLNILSNICNAYNADGLYVIDSTQHSPLIGFAYDGFPIYGAYAFKNVDGTGGITRMKSSYKLRNITTRTTWADGTSVLAGPPVSLTYPLGYFKEDYEYRATGTSTPDFLDDHNGRFCVTPEYPNGTYCYFATVDSLWNSAYPYIVGPYFYGVKTQAPKPATITEAVTQYTGSVLPINLFDFSGVSKNNKIILSWSFSNEAFAKRYDVERSINGIQFEKIGTVISNSNNNGKKYTFNDLHPFQGVNYYRLNQLDISGKTNLSNTIAVKNYSFMYNVVVYPNPASEYIAIQVNDILRKDLQIFLTDLSGHIVLKKQLFQGSTTCFLETATLYDGLYTLTIIVENTKSSYEIKIKH